MLPYWILYSIPAFILLFTIGNHLRLRLTVSFWVGLGLFATLFIGFRYEVGGDWVTYLRISNDAIGLPFTQGMLLSRDPGYALLNWVMAKWGFGIYGVNLVCGALFVTGLIMFCRVQKNPLLAFTVAIPYLMIVAVMGYSRQGVALGLLFWAISYIERGKLWHYIALIVFAALFHKTVLIMLPFGVLLYGKGRILRVGAILLAGYALWDLFLMDSQDLLWHNYVDAQMVSTGAKIRIYMNLVPSLLLLIYWKSWKHHFPNPWFWLAIAVASVVTVGLVDYASTAIDRIALYFAPIQLAVYSRLASLPLLPRRQLDPNMVTAGVVFAYAAVLYVWLNFGRLAFAWLPYQSIIFQ